MTKSERILGLSEKDQRRLEEEYARMEKGANLAEQPKLQLEKNSLSKNPTERTAKAGRSDVEIADLPDYVGNWVENNPDYSLENLSPYTVISFKEGAKDLPIEFLDYLVTNAKIKLGPQKFLDDIMGIVIYPPEDQVVIGLTNSEGITIWLFFDKKPPFNFSEIKSRP